MKMKNVVKESQGRKQSQCLRQRCPAFYTDQVADHQPLETEVVHMIDQSQEGLCISLAVNEELTSNNVPYHSTRMRHPRFENVQDGCYHVCPD